MSPTIPTTEPESFIAGNTVKWDKDVSSDYPASTWTLTYNFTSPNLNKTITATNTGDIFNIVISASDSAEFAKDKSDVFAYHANVTASGEVYTIESGQMTVFPGYANVSEGADIRSWAERELERAQNHMANSSGFDVIEIKTEDDRVYKLNSLQQKTDYINYLKNLINSEKTADEIAKGNTDKSNRVLVEFVPPS